MMLRHLSPLRYPGGKAPMAPWLSDMFAAQWTDLPLEVWLEPFAGGAGAGLTMLNDSAVEELWLIDQNAGIAALWRAIVDDASAFATRIEATAPTLALYERCREMLAEPDGVDGFELGFAAFIVNRCSRSGIVSPTSGPIGGRSQGGQWTVASRFNAADLAARVRRIGELGGRIRVWHGDGIAYLEQLPGSGIDGEVMAFVDPPYVREGNRLYTAGLDRAGHERIARALNALSDAGGLWVLTYDDEPVVSDDWYRDRRVLAYEIRNTAARARVAVEYAVFSDAVAIDPDAAPLRGKQAVWVERAAAA